MLGLDQQRELLEHQRALVRRASGPRLESARSTGDRRLQIFGIAQPDLADAAGVVRVSDGLHELRVAILAADVRAQSAFGHAARSISRGLIGLSSHGSIARENSPTLDNHSVGTNFTGIIRDSVLHVVSSYPASDSAGNLLENPTG